MDSNEALGDVGFNGNTGKFNMQGGFFFSSPFLTLSKSLQFYEELMTLAKSNTEVVQCRTSSMHRVVTENNTKISVLFVLGV